MLCRDFVQRPESPNAASTDFSTAAVHRGKQNRKLRWTFDTDAIINVLVKVSMVDLAWHSADRSAMLGNSCSHSGLAPFLCQKKTPRHVSYFLWPKDRPRRGEKIDLHSMALTLVSCSWHVRLFPSWVLNAICTMALHWRRQDEQSGDLDKHRSDWETERSMAENRNQHLH